MLSLQQAAEARHAVRTYTDKPLDPEAVADMQALIDELNEESWLEMQIVRDEPKALSCLTARMAGFSGVRNYLAMVGPDNPDLGIAIGYCGEQVVLRAQQWGINSCWVGKTFKLGNRGAAVDIGQRLMAVVALGYGTTQGEPHKSKLPQQVSSSYDTAPEWFRQGVDAALLAPTAMNQQKFSFALGQQLPDGRYEVDAKPGLGPYAKLDLGIAMFHFELGAGKENFKWRGYGED